MNREELTEFLRNHALHAAKTGALTEEKPWAVPIDYSELLDECPSAARCPHPLKLLNTLKLCLAQETGAFNFSVQVHSSPYTSASFETLPTNQISNLSNLRVTSVSDSKTFEEWTEYICLTCSTPTFSCADLTLFNQITSPRYCMPVPSSCLVPQSKQLASRTTASCDGTQFYVLEQGRFFSDYQEVLLSDGESVMPGILIGTLCNQLSPGHLVDVTASKVPRWCKEPVTQQFCELEYALVVHSFTAHAMPRVRSTKPAFTSDCEKVQLLVQSSFTAVYQNYHAKYALLLAVAAQRSGFPLNLLLLGETATGKSTLLAEFAKLVPSAKRLPGRVVNASTFQCVSGQFTEDMLLIDDFHKLKCLPQAFEAMQYRTVLASVTPDESKASAKLFAADARKDGPLPPSLDRFDIIIRMQQVESDRDFVRKQLEDSSVEDGVWDFHTLQEYLEQIDKREIRLVQSQVRSLLESFVQFVITCNLKSGRAGSASVRLLEALIKACKAHAALLGHCEVTLQDALDVLLFFHLAGRDSWLAHLSIKHADVRTEELTRLLRSIQEIVG